MLDDCTPQTDQNTTQYNKVTYTYKGDKNYQATCRRVSVEMNATNRFCMFKFCKALEYYEVLEFSVCFRMITHILLNILVILWKLRIVSNQYNLKAAMDASSTQKILP